MNDNSDILYFDVDTDLVERKPNMFLFIPDTFITVTHHLKKVVAEIGLCGYTKLSSDWFVPVFLKGTVIFTV